MTQSSDAFAQCEDHDQPHRPVLSQLLATDWMLTVERNEADTHTRFALLRGEQSREVVACFEGNPVPDGEYGFDAEAVLDIVAHVTWHIVGAAPPGSCE